MLFNLTGITWTVLKCQFPCIPSSGPLRELGRSSPESSVTSNQSLLKQFVVNGRVATYIECACRCFLLGRSPSCLRDHLNKIHVRELDMDLSIQMCRQKTGRIGGRSGNARRWEGKSNGEEEGRRWVSLGNSTPTLMA